MTRDRGWAVEGGAGDLGARVPHTFLIVFQVFCEFFTNCIVYLPPSSRGAGCIGISDGDLDTDRCPGV